jgi:hypothetical protein
MSRQLAVYTSPDRPGAHIVHDRRGWWQVDLEAETWKRHRGQARLDPVTLTSDLLDQIEALRPVDKGGRPEVGPPVPVRLSPDLLARLDGDAATHGESRAAAIRRLLDKTLPPGAEG